MGGAELLSFSSVSQVIPRNRCLDCALLKNRGGNERFWYRPEDVFELWRSWRPRGSLLLVLWGTGSGPSRQSACTAGRGE